MENPKIVIPFSMSFPSIIVFVFIHLLVPLAGLIIYIRLINKLKGQNLIGSLGIYFLFIFVTYGELLMVILTAMLWKWSGMASLGMFYLVLPAPILMALTAYNNKKLQNTSKYHLFVFRAGLFYFIIFPLIFLITFLSKNFIDF